ncbi:hypothetical protein QJS10_CPA01g00779 [Acorus calamus]|uniref:Uncharacterized protein n=1 Tax=Acorus calamus TaxID=4465 RepID=A0AAV9FL66_ACOCL|nr:hypothetical protein QJS10_CPA01g00779 [Acorus calamus]
MMDFHVTSIPSIISDKLIWSNHCETPLKRDEGGLEEQLRMDKQNHHDDMKTKLLDDRDSLKHVETNSRICPVFPVTELCQIARTEVRAPEVCWLYKLDKMIRFEDGYHWLRLRCLFV